MNYLNMSIDYYQQHNYHNYSIRSYHTRILERLVRLLDLEWMGILKLDKSLKWKWIVWLTFEFLVVITNSWGLVVFLRFWKMKQDMILMLPNTIKYLELQTWRQLDLQTERKYKFFQWLDRNNSYDLWLFYCQNLTSSWNTKAGISKCHRRVHC